MCGPFGDQALSIFGAFPDFAELHASGFAGVVCEKPAVMIAMTPRTGSTHLCAALAQTDGVARPTEIFNPRGVLYEEAARRGVRLFADFMRSFNNDGGPCFFFKTSWQDFSPLAKFHNQIFPNLRVVYLERRDIIAQAVSLYRAAESGRWHVARRDSAALAPDGMADTDLDLSRLSWWLGKIEEERRGWRRFFATDAIAPLLLYYEDFSTDISRAVAAIAEYLQLPLKTEIGPDVGFHRLADGVSAAWVARARQHVLRMT